MLKSLFQKTEEKLGELNWWKLQNANGNYWQFSTEGLPKCSFCQVLVCILGFFTNLNEKNICTFCYKYTCALALWVFVLMCFSSDTLRSSAVQVCSEAVGGQKLHKCEDSNIYMCSTTGLLPQFPIWFVWNMTWGCGCGEQMIQALCYDYHVFDIHGAECFRASALRAMFFNSGFSMKHSF